MQHSRKPSVKEAIVMVLIYIKNTEVKLLKLSVVDPVGLEPTTAPL